MLMGHLEEPTDGTNLRRYVKSRGILPVERAVSIAHEVALALSAAHQRGIVHGNVNPQTIVVRHNGSIQLIGFAVNSNMNLVLRGGLYCAPEQAKREATTPATDVYALGIVLYEMLTGRTPFEGDTSLPPRELNPGIPPELEEIILGCLEKQPETRYRDGSALVRALEGLT